jgi:hypothetical protein
VRRAGERPPLRRLREREAEPLVDGERTREAAPDRVDVLPRALEDAAGNSRRGGDEGSGTVVQLRGSAGDVESSVREPLGGEGDEEEDAAPEVAEPAREEEPRDEEEGRGGRRLLRESREDRSEDDVRIGSPRGVPEREEETARKRRAQPCGDRGEAEEAGEDEEDEAGAGAPAGERLLEEEPLDRERREDGDGDRHDEERLDRVADGVKERERFVGGARPGDPREDRHEEREGGGTEPEAAFAATRAEREGGREGEREDAERERGEVGRVPLRRGEAPVGAREDPRRVAEEEREGGLEEAERVEADGRELRPGEAAEAAGGGLRRAEDVEEERGRGQEGEDASADERADRAQACPMGSGERESEREEDPDQAEGGLARVREEGPRGGRAEEGEAEGVSPVEPGRGDRGEEPGSPGERRGRVQEGGAREGEAGEAERERSRERRLGRASEEAEEEEEAEPSERRVEQEVDAEPAGGDGERIGEDEVRVPAPGLAERGVRVQRGVAERGGEGAGGALGRREVPERGRRAPREEIEVREADGEEDERGDGRGRSRLT